MSGSSPRVRGKPMPVTNVDWETRIIPARAGQTRAGHSHHRQVPDHPRACGANLLLVESCVLDAGSSPRVRGKLSHCRESAMSDRIIPARAGQTGSHHLNDDGHTDHPRACGANPV